MHADIVLKSNAIFTGIEATPFKGSVAIEDNKITAVFHAGSEEVFDSSTKILDYGNKLICPGFTDVHCFFTGYLLTISGIDLVSCHSAAKVTDALLMQKSILSPQELLLARNVNPSYIELDTKFLDKLFPDHSVILMHPDGESCFMNTCARNTFQFTPTTCWSEKYWRLLRYLLQQPQAKVEFKKYLTFLNSRGITSIKEMGFDNFWGFTDVLKELEAEKALTARISFMSQPVGEPLNIAYGKEMKEKFLGDYVSFSGYNQMTDGSISQTEGEMKSPYLDEATCCIKEINWPLLEKDTLEVDKNGFRFSLHAQGDGAICRTIDIFDKCAKNADGTLINRHAMTDLECSDPKDIERMGKLGILAEIYPQIMSLATKESKVNMINHKIGEVRGRNYWNRRKMVDSGVIISCATDLPLLIDNIPESIYHTVGGLFPEGGEPFNVQNTLTTAELMKAWTIGGQYNLGFDNILGTLEVGKKADLCVFDQNIFVTSIDSIRDAKVICTIFDGKIVYQN